VWFEKREKTPRSGFLISPGSEAVRVGRRIGWPGPRVRVEMFHRLVIGRRRPLPPPRERAAEEGEEARRGSEGEK
jgi:hypothetical protein